jgi:hypothetical protein
MIATGRIPTIAGAPQPSQDPTVRRRSRNRAFFAQRLKFALQALQFRDAFFHVKEMGIQQGVDLAAIFSSPGAKSQQNSDFIQRHVQGTAMSNER